MKGNPLIQEVSVFHVQTQGKKVVKEGKTEKSSEEYSFEYNTMMYLLFLGALDLNLGAETPIGILDDSDSEGLVKRSALKSVGERS